MVGTLARRKALDPFRSSIESLGQRLAADRGATAARIAVLSCVAHRVLLRNSDSDRTAGSWIDELSPSRDTSESPSRVVSDEQRHAIASAVEWPADALGPGTLGDVHQWLLAATDAGGRKRAGSFFTPAALAAYVVRAALGNCADTDRNFLDPALGAGRFLLEALAFLPPDKLFGIDIDPVAVWIARVALNAATGLHDDSVCDRITVGDALSDEFAWPCTPDVVAGNPPWVAFMGRQAEPLSPETRESFRARFHAFSGYPTTQGMFIERAARALAPSGRLAFLVPTQVADLDGYGPTRRALTSVARVECPLEDLGFERFEGVVEPTLVLIAERTPDARSTDEPWPIRGNERLHHADAPAQLHAWTVLDALRALPKLPPETFGEAGFQTAGALSRTHLSAWPPTDSRFTIALREGRDVDAFFAGPPSRALDPEPAALAAARTRLRPIEVYDRVSVLIRQTARMPIAALHAPVFGFRNSLLAGYTDDPWWLVALLNSRVLREFHLSTQRDGRQAVFPQVKVSHLRNLPAPPDRAHDTALRALSRELAESQRERHETIAKLQRASVDAGAAHVSVARWLRPEGADVPARAHVLAQIRPRDPRALERAYGESLDVARRCWRAFVAVSATLDALVESAYGLTPRPDADAARASLAEISRASPPG